MDYGIIDIGSNSVRLMLTQGAKSEKRIETTRLSEGFASTGKLSGDRMRATAEAVKKFVETARNTGAEVYAYATEAVRSAENGAEFVKLCSDFVAIDVLDSSTEARLGFYGAFDGFETAAVADVGGASTEIAVGNDSGLFYARSVSVGVVKIKNLCGENFGKIQSFVKEKVAEYGIVPKADKLFAIGGTAGTVAAILKQAQIYVSEQIHGTVISRAELVDTARLILSTPADQRNKIAGLPLSRADITAGGALLYAEILEFLKLPCLTVSEKDNLEGYLKVKILKEIKL